MAASPPGAGLPDRVCVLVAAAGATWERSALPELATGGVVVLKRCVDLTDLLATASSGQADVALVDGALGGLDADAVVHLLRYDVRTVAVTDDPHEPARLARLGVVASVSGSPASTAEGRSESWADTVSRVASEEVLVDPHPAGAADPGGHDGSRRPRDRGRTVAIWGPAGAPGRTTVATCLAGLRAEAGAPVVLVDADPHGGTVAQHLGVLDEVSGILAAARLANAGGLDAGGFASCRRRVAEHLEVLTGLPRADRWVEVRAGVLEQVLDLSAEVGDVVVDCGFSLEDDFDPGRAGGRNQLTLDAVAVADEVVVVGSAEPTGLARLARGLVEMAELTPAPLRVVVNRMRGSLGWSERDILGMVEGYVRPVGVHFLPEDRPAVDRALVAGRSAVELGESPLRQALAAIDVFAPLAEPAPARAGRRRARR